MRDKKERWGKIIEAITTGVNVVISGVNVGIFIALIYILFGIMTSPSKKLPPLISGQYLEQLEQLEQLEKF
jgi:hypothetical protein